MTAERRIGIAMALVAGGLVLMLPWQKHCFYATGALCYRVYATDPLQLAARSTDDGNLVYQWLRTWSLGERHIHVLHRNNPGGAPDWAFSNRADKQMFPAPEERLPHGLTAGQRNVIYEDLQRKVGYLRVYGLTVVRSATLWLDMRQNGHAQMGYIFPFGLQKVASAEGTERALMRSIKVAFSSIAYVLYILIPLIFLFAVCCAGRGRQFFVLGVFLAVLLYTVITAYTAHNESRRNVVFLPAMALAIAVCLRGRDDERGGV
jgi:hypothetical protein